MRTIIAVFIMGFILSGCDKGQESTESTESTGSMEKTPAQKMESSSSTMIVDHTKDEKEFILKRELWGVEAMIEDYKQHGYDTADYEKRKAELEKELNNLM